MNFRIEPEGGGVFLKNALDRERVAKHEVLILAIDEGNIKFGSCDLFFTLAPYTFMRINATFTGTVTVTVVSGTFDLFDVTCKQHHKTIEPIFKWYKK